MIHEVDVALRSLIEREATAGTEVEVVFDAPTKDWAGRRNAPTIDVYLYDIREDLRRRERGLINEYDERDRVRARHLPPRHFKLSYLVTAWTQRPEDEHRLLAALLSCFLRHDAIPEEFLTGPLAELALPVPVTVALPPPEDRSFADVWSALGGELKPSLDVVVSAPTDTGQQYVAGPPVERPPTISLGGTGGQGWPPREDRQRWTAVAGASSDTRGAAASGDADEPATRSSTRRTGSRTSRHGATASGPVAIARGLSWRELAENGRRGAAATAAVTTTKPGPDAAATSPGPDAPTTTSGPDPAAKMSGTDAAATTPGPDAATTTPGSGAAGKAERRPRRRRSTGIDPK